jgi:hypothetical protein
MASANSKYWFGVLLDSIASGDEGGLRQAENALRSAGFIVAVNPTIPVRNLLSRPELIGLVRGEGRTDG